MFHTSYVQRHCDIDIHSTFPVPVGQRKMWPGCFTCVSMGSTDGELWEQHVNPQASATHNYEKSHPCLSIYTEIFQIPPSPRSASETACTSGPEIQFWAKNVLLKEDQILPVVKNKCVYYLISMGGWEESEVVRVRWSSTDKGMEIQGSGNIPFQEEDSAWGTVVGQEKSRMNQKL